MKKDEAKDAKVATRKVRAPQAPGVVSFGAYKPGDVYDLPAAEADRLVKCKGFEPAD